MAAGRPIDVPLEGLPPIDEHSIEVSASSQATWEALFPGLEGFDGPLSRRIARALGCAQLETSGDLRHPGGTVPGFVVARAIPSVLVALLGAHRFSRYALVFRIDRLSDGRCRLRAETRAEFPGLAGRAYRAAVIGTRVHRLVVRRLLRATRGRAERGNG